jgi:large subunit ribosomal protein L10
LAISKDKKDEIIAEYNSLLEKSEAIFITQYGGLKMPELDKVRGAVRGTSGEFHVTKNTLIAKALKAKGFDVPDDWLTGTTGMSFAFKDAAATAKAVNDLAKEFEKFKVVGGVMNGKPLDSANVIALATLPPLDTLRAQIIGAISAPASNLVGVLNAAVGSVMYALQARIDKESNSEG